MRTAVFSVVYPGVEPFLGDFLHSLAGQSDRDFDLFLINDGCAGLDQALAAYPLPALVKELPGPPSALRKAGIAWTSGAGGELILFADADDYFAGNRVELSRQMLSHRDLACNELTVIGQDIATPFGMLGKRFAEGTAIKSGDIRHGNCLGLSNTAIRSRIIPRGLEQIPDEIIAFDWAFFSLCLQGGAQGVFTGMTQTYYRQHGHNTACIRPLSEEQILRGVRVKADHYRFLSRYEGTWDSLAADFAGLQTSLSADAALLQKYCRAVRRLSPPVPLWWEPIKTLEELGL